MPRALTLCVVVCIFQLEELLKEVQVLREELKSRDTTIAQLTLQCQQLQQQHQQMVSYAAQDLGIKHKPLTYIVSTNLISRKENTL